MTSLSSVPAPFAKENDSGHNPTLMAMLCQNFDMYTFMYKNSRPPPRPGVGSWWLWILSLLQEHHHHPITMCWKPCGSHMPMLSFQFGGQLACCMHRLHHWSNNLFLRITLFQVVNLHAYPYFYAWPYPASPTIKFIVATRYRGRKKVDPRLREFCS